MSESQDSTVSEKHKERSSQTSDAVASEDSPGGKSGPRELGGREGPDPTRYGDWEKAGRCVDF